MGIYKQSCKRSPKTITYVDKLKEYSEQDNINEMRTMMLDRDVWRDMSNMSRMRAEHK